MLFEDMSMLFAWSLAWSVQYTARLAVGLQFDLKKYVYKTDLSTYLSIN